MMSLQLTSCSDGSFFFMVTTIYDDAYYAFTCLVAAAADVFYFSECPHTSSHLPYYEQHHVPKEEQKFCILIHLLQPSHQILRIKYCTIVKFNLVLDLFVMVITTCQVDKELKGAHLRFIVPATVCSSDFVSCSSFGA
jgi:hypothetical protein